jgi:hypothetical protein
MNQCGNNPPRYFQYSWGLCMRSPSSRLIVVLALALLLAGCASIGPATIKRDRTDYSGSMASSWKEQMLLNIVKFRYFDPPVFLDVSSVVSTQELQTQADATARLFPHPSGTSQGYGNVEVIGRYTDRPTVSYTPLTGERFINSLLRPIPPQTIFSMIEAGHDAGFILQLAVRGINGIYNSSYSPARERRIDPAFDKVRTAIRRIQQAGAIGMRTVPIAKGTAAWVSFRPGAGVDGDIRFVKTVLHIAAPRDEFLLIFGSRHKANEIALLTRSMQEIMTELSAGVDVPGEDIAEGRATPSRVGADAETTYPLIHIHASNTAPIDAYAVAHYRDLYFWVDDQDLRSKRVFMFLMMMSALSETRAVPQVPIVTIPTN